MAIETNPFVVHNPSFHDILGSNPTLKCLLEKNEPFAHEAGIFIPSTQELFITSNRHQFSSSEEQSVKISKIKLDRSTLSATQDELKLPSEVIAMANGGVNYKNNTVLICAQGNMQSPSGLYEMNISPPYETTLVISGFYGRPFNSVNDVVVHSDGSIWFTDPNYGHKQGYREPPSLPSQVYRYDPSTKSIRAMADGFGKPNGICFSPDEKTVYITDTARYHGVDDLSEHHHEPSNIYGFDVSIYHGQPFLTNRRLFSMAEKGIPDGIKCDIKGNVYSGCGDGINIWSPGGVLLGRIIVPNGVANFCFGQGGEMFLLNEERLWRAQLNSTVQGALLEI